jgi:membrane protein implicated in regulation of membrane protease activity
MDSPETWRWIWLAAAVVFAGGEIAVAGTFFLLSFAVGAAAAAVIAFAGGALLLQWIAFVVVSAAGLAALPRLGRRLDDHHDQPTAGAGRLEGRVATVITDIPAGLHEPGTVRIERETWRAVSTNGTPIAAGARVLVDRVTGTRLVVTPYPIGAANPPH